MLFTIASNDKQLLIYPLINCYGDGKVGVLLSRQLFCKDKVVDFPKILIYVKEMLMIYPRINWYRKRTFDESASHELLW